MKKILPLFSYLLHPILIPLLAPLMYFAYGDSYLPIEQKMVLLLQIAILTVFIPLCFFLLLRAMSKADSVMLPKSSQRKWPLFLQMLFTGILLWKSLPEDIVPALHYFFLAGMASTAVAFVFLFAEVKASLHVIGLAALTSFAIGLSINQQINALYEIAGLVLLTGLVAASRIEMKAHDVKEIIIGFLAGAVPQLLFFKFWL